MLFTFKKLKTALKKETNPGNFLVKVEGVTEEGKSVLIIFYISPDFSTYCVSEPHEIKRGLRFDNSEWKRSERWENPEEKLNHEEVDAILILWDKRSEILREFRRKMTHGSPALQAIKKETTALTEKNNKNLAALGVKPATNTIGDFLPQPSK